MYFKLDERLGHKNTKNTKTQKINYNFFKKCHYDEKFNFPVPLYLQCKSTYL